MTEYSAAAERGRMIDLAFAQGYDPTRTMHDEGAMQASADQAYVTMHSAGVMGDEPFVFPSVRLAQENRKAMREQTEISSSPSDDPAVALVDSPSWPAAVREAEDHVDEFDEDSYSTRRWLGFLSFDDAQGYVDRVGDYLEISGPGEFLGTFYSRTAHRNPHYREATNG